MINSEVILKKYIWPLNKPCLDLSHPRYLSLNVCVNFSIGL